MRVLDLDLDFFLYGKAHRRDSVEERLDPDDCPPWPIDMAIGFLTDNCQLDGRRPGFVVEHHNELFYLWGEAIKAGSMQAPFDVVHIDAHADLGLGDSGFAYLMCELAFEPVADRYEIMKRRKPNSREEMLERSDALRDGNWLMFAVACGWISDLIYVCNSFAETTTEHTPDDLPRSLVHAVDRDSGCLQVVATREEALLWAGSRPRVIESRDPPVPFTVNTLREFRPAEPFDIVCLTRSPPYTPAEADPIFDAIRARFIDEEKLR